MFKFKGNMMLVLVFGILFYFNSNAQVDTTMDAPTDTMMVNPDAQTGTPNEFGTPQTGNPNEFGAPQTQADTSGKYAVHFRLAEEITERLGQSINLTEQQKNDVLGRIVEFQEEVADVNMEMREGEDVNQTQADLDNELVSLVTDIEGMLDESQQAEWIRMKNDWMTEVKANIQSENDVNRQERDNYSE